MSVMLPKLLLSRIALTTLRMADFSNCVLFHGFMKADLRISIKDYSRNKNLKVLLIRMPFSDG